LKIFYFTKAQSDDKRGIDFFFVDKQKNLSSKTLDLGFNVGNVGTNNFVNLLTVLEVQDGRHGTDSIFGSNILIKKK
jgi:hypothetical protein